MKKKMIIGIIIAAVVIIAGGFSGVVYKKDHENTNTSVSRNANLNKNTSSGTSTSSNSNTNSKDVANKEKNLVKVNSENLKTTNNENLNEIEAVNNINTGKNQVLAGEAQGFLQKLNEIDSFGNREGKKQEYQTDVGMIALNNQLEDKFMSTRKEINKEIEENTDKGVGEALNSQAQIWEGYISYENQAIAKDGGTVIAVDQSGNYSGIQEQEARFNVYNYMVDSELSAEMPNSYIEETINSYEKGNVVKYMSPNQVKYFNRAVDEINNLQKEGNEIVNTAVSKKTSLETAYNQVYYLWNNYLNKLYESVIDKSVYRNQIKQEEIPWVNFKESMINSEKLAYQNKVELDLAQAKMNIRLTQEQVLNLIVSL